MKFNIVRFTLLMLAAFSLTMVGCLKDKAFDNGEIQSGAGSNSTIEVVGIGLTVSSTSNFLVASFNNSNSDTTIQLIPVTLGGTSAATQDIHVTLTANDSLISNYDTANGTDYVVPPSSLFTIVNSGVVIIPKGQRTGYLQITFKPSDFLGVNYAVGFTITKIQEAGYTISGNLNNGIVAIGIKNAYDADYQVTGWFFHPSSGRAINTVKHLSTVSATGLQGGVGDLGTPFQFDVINNALKNWASSGFTSSGFMTADNPGNTDYSSSTNQGHVPGDATFNSTIYNNTYDPATKTFYMHYGYKNGASVDQTGYNRQIYEKWVRIN